MAYLLRRRPQLRSRQRESTWDVQKHGHSEAESKIFVGRPFTMMSSFTIASVRRQTEIAASATFHTEVRPLSFKPHIVHYQHIDVQESFLLTKLRKLAVFASPISFVL